MAEGDAAMASSESAAAAAADSPVAAVPAAEVEDAGDAASDSDAASEQQRNHKKRKAVDDGSDADGSEAGGGGGDEDDGAAGEESDGGGSSAGEKPRKHKRKKHKKDKKHKKHKKSRPGARFIDDIAVNEDDEDERDSESDDPEEEDNGDGEPDEGEDLDDTAEGDARDNSDEDARELESPAERKARRKLEKANRRLGLGHGGDDETMHMTLDQIREREEAEKLQAQVADRYRDSGGYGDDDYDEDGANGRSRGSVLPSIKDPSLFLIKVRRGVDEREALRALLKEFQVREDGSDESRKLHILSAFTTPASRGCIYVEAFKEAHLKAALTSVPLGRSLYAYYAQSTTNIKVPIQEMVAALKFRSLDKSVAEGAWVRMKRGPFKDDLARVVRLQDQGAIITLKLLPRINFNYLEAKRDNDKLSLADFSRSRNAAEAGRRPPQKLFDRHEIASLGFGKQIERKRGMGGDKDVMYDTFMNMRFKGGFLYKDVRLDALQLDNVLPTAAELDAFAQKSHGSDDDDDDEAEREQADSAAAAHSAAQNAPRRPVVYSLNDRVLITGGALKDVTGRVRRIEKDRLTIAPDNLRTSVGDVQEVYVHVRKYFTVSTHVKVVAGIYKDESGMVTHVFDAEEGPDGEQQLALHTDISVRDIIVSSQDVIESSEISTGRETFGNFSLGDLVQLGGDLVGTIIRINVASIVVLTSAGVVQDVKLQEVAFKRNDRFARTTDRHSQDVELGDVVYPLSGPHRGKRATVKHIFKKTLFLHSPELLDNGGLFTIRGEQVSLPQTTQSKPTAPKSPSAGARSPGPAPRSPSHSGLAGPGANRTGRPLRDPIIGKDVKITGGQYKGYAGVCLDVIDTHARVEIRAVFRKVQVPRAQITLLENVAARASQYAAAGAGGVMYGGATPLVGGATPAHTGFGSQTPGHEAGGSMTPYGAGGSRTPSHRTPSHDGDAGVWAPQTPARRHEEEETPAEEEEEDEWRKTMQQDGDSLRTPGGAAANPLTPGGAVPQTPRTPFVPQTPYDPSTPHVAGAAGGDEDEEMAAAPVPQTPATPYDPSAQAAMEEGEAEAAVPEGLFTSQNCVGCHVTLEGGNGDVHVITAVDDEYNVHVRPLSAPHADATVVSQAHVRPVHPADNTMQPGMTVLVLRAVKSHEAGTVLTIGSRGGGDMWLVRAKNVDADIIELSVVQNDLCVYDANVAAAGTKKGKKKSKR